MKKSKLPIVPMLFSALTAVVVTVALFDLDDSSPANGRSTTPSPTGNVCFWSCPSPSSSSSPTATPTPTKSIAGLGIAHDPQAPGVRAYTVQRGDSISAISLKLGVPWQSIYKLNAGIIEAQAHENGHANSDGGNLIFSGLTLILP